MATVTFNTDQNFDVVWRYKSSTAAFSSDLSTSTAFDFFDDDFAVGDYLAMGKIDKLDIGKKFRNIKINVGTAVNATSFAIKLQYCMGSGQTWTDVADVTSSFSSTGAKTITFEPPDLWKCNYFSALNGKKGWFIRFIITAVDTPTEGGAEQTSTVKCGNNTFTASNLGGGDAMAAIYSHDVSNSIGLVKKYGTKTYLIGKCFLLIGTDDSKTTMSGVDIIFDKSDTYYVLFDSCELDLTSVFYTMDLKGYENNNALYWANIFNDVKGKVNSCSFVTASTYSQPIYRGDDGQTMEVTNCYFKHDYNYYIVFVDGNWKIKNLTVSGSFESRLNDSMINGLVADRFGYYNPGMRSIVYNAMTKERNTKVDYTYTSSGMVNSKSDQGEFYPATSSNSNDMNFINYTTQFFLRDTSGNPLKDVIVKAKDSSAVRSGTLNYNMGSSDSVVPIESAKGSLLNRDSVIKIEDEYIRVTFPRGGYFGAYGGTYPPYVERGVWGSTAVAHSSGTAWEVVGENYYKTGYVDWDFTVEHFINSQGVTDGTAITTIDYQIQNPTPLRVKVTDKTTNGYITIVGEDISGISISERIDIAKDGYYNTVNDFTKITSVTSTTLVATISIGLYGTFYPQHITVKRASSQVGVISENPITYTFEKSGYDIVTDTTFVSKQIKAPVEMRTESSGSSISHSYIG